MREYREFSIQTLSIGNHYHLHVMDNHKVIAKVKSRKYRNTRKRVKELIDSWYARMYSYNDESDDYFPRSCAETA